MIFSAIVGGLAYRSGALSRSEEACAMVIGAGLFGFGGWGASLIAFFVSSSGLVGAPFDSVLGMVVQATYFCAACDKETEQPFHRCGQPAPHLRGWRQLSNDEVNFLASLVGAIVAASLVPLISP